MIFQRKMVISHDFTIILGVREKYFFAYPPRTKKKSRTRYAKFSQALGGLENRTPQLGGYATFFFAYRVRNVSFLFFLRTGYATLRGTSVPECRVRAVFTPQCTQGHLAL